MYLGLITLMYVTSAYHVSPEKIEEKRTHAQTALIPLYPLVISKTLYIFLSRVLYVYSILFCCCLMSAYPRAVMFSVKISSLVFTYAYILFFRLFLISFSSLLFSIIRSDSHIQHLIFFFFFFFFCPVNDLQER